MFASPSLNGFRSFAVRTRQLASRSYFFLLRAFRFTCPYRLSANFRLRLKCDGTRAETRFRLSAKRTSPFKSAGASVLSTTGSRGVRISGSNAGYTMFRGSVKSTGYTLHSPVSPSLPLPCVTVCHHISIGVYLPLKVPTKFLQVTLTSLTLAT